MEKKSSNNLEITVLSAENLRINRKLVKKNAFVVVRIDPNVNLATRIDTNGGGYPSWNEKLVMELPMHARFITIEVHCKASSNGSKLIGTALVPVSDFAGGYLPQNYLHMLSYRLRDQDGNRNGIINLSVKLNSNMRGYEYPERKTLEYGCSSSNVASLGVGIPIGRESYGAVATGVPVWCP